MNVPDPLRQIARSNSAAKWVTFVQRAFEEEYLRYRGDEQGGVHYKPDDEFARNPASALSSLQSSRYNAVREAFETARSSLDSREPENAIRSVFIAAAIASRRSLLGVSIAGLARHGSTLSIVRAGLANTLVALCHGPSTWAAPAAARARGFPSQGATARPRARGWLGLRGTEGRRSAARGANAPGREEAEFELLDD